jgi:hypothetical protein
LALARGQEQRAWVALGAPGSRRGAPRRRAWWAPELTEAITAQHFAVRGRSFVKVARRFVNMMLPRIEMNRRLAMLGERFEI